MTQILIMSFKRGRGPGTLSALACYLEYLWLRGHRHKARRLLKQTRMDHLWYTIQEPWACLPLYTLGPGDKAFARLGRAYEASWHQNQQVHDSSLTSAYLIRMLCRGNRLAELSSCMEHAMLYLPQTHHQHRAFKRILERTIARLESADLLPPPSTQDNLSVPIREMYHWFELVCGNLFHEENAMEHVLALQSHYTQHQYENDEDLLFHHALSLRSALSSSPGDPNLLKRFKHCHTLLTRLVQIDQPSSHRVRFLNALDASDKGDQEKALEHFASLLKELDSCAHGEQGIIFEHAARFYQACNLTRLQKTSLDKAYHNYQLWGAKGKLKHIEAVVKAANQPVLPVPTRNHIVSNQVFDQHSFMAAAQAISSEIVLDRLLVKLMELVIQNAGAQKGVLLLPNEASWEVRVTGVSQQAIATGRQLLSETTDIATSIVGYVARTQETLVLDNTAEAELFCHDAYIASTRLKSVLCLPILRHGELSAILYLENNLNHGAFTSDHLEILRIISSQAAISLENANLYNHLENMVRERTHELVERNKQIMSSIQYARRIQSAILPDRDQIQKVLPHSFILFLPKDVVSGDFFWFSQRKNHLFLAVVDCTGHGVPGAFMSMIGNTLLNQIVNERGIDQPDKIMEILHRQVRYSLKQDDRRSGANDGMELALCRLDLDINTLAFCGARRPIYLGKSEQKEIIEIRGDLKSIGGHRKEQHRVFTNHELTLKPGDRVYLCSDGFADQPNEHGKKYSSKKLKKLFGSILALPLAEQEIQLKSELERHMGTEDQRDDISIWGFGIS